MNDKLPYDHYDELNVHYVGETFAEFAKSDLDYETDRTDAGLFEIEETNRDVLDAVDAESSTDLRGALREAEQMRRLIETAPEMFKAIRDEVMDCDHQGLTDADSFKAVGCSDCHALASALPNLDVDLDEAFPWLGERDAAPRGDVR